MLLLALAKKSEPEHMTGDSNIWVTILLSDRELFTRRFSVGIELLLLVYLKCAFPFFTSVSKGSIYAISECVNVLHLQSHGRCFLPVPWFSSSQWVPVKPEKNCCYPAHRLWRAFPNPSPSCTEQRIPTLVSAGPFRNLLWSHPSVIPLLTALLFYTQFPT